VRVKDALQALSFFTSISIVKYILFLIACFFFCCVGCSSSEGRNVSCVVGSKRDAARCVITFFIVGRCFVLLQYSANLLFFLNIDCGLQSPRRREGGCYCRVLFRAYRCDGAAEYVSGAFLNAGFLVSLLSSPSHS
jgi:hypothetical protein